MPRTPRAIVPSPEIPLQTPLLAAALAALPLMAAAEPAADPAQPVPATEYRSVLRGPTGVADQDLPWRKANEDVARFPRGHADLLKWEEKQAAPARPGASAPASPATPAAPRRHGHGDH